MSAISRTALRIIDDRIHSNLFSNVILFFSLWSLERLFTACYGVIVLIIRSVRVLSIVVELCSFLFLAVEYISRVLNASISRFIELYLWYFNQRILLLIVAELLFQCYLLILCSWTFQFISFLMSIPVPIVIVYIKIYSCIDDRPDTDSFSGLVFFFRFCHFSGFSSSYYYYYYREIIVLAKFLFFVIEYFTCMKRIHFPIR